jgi:hypothetical protein
VAYRHGLALILGGLCALGTPAAAEESVATLSAAPPARPEGFAPGAEPAAAHDLFAMPEVMGALQRMAAAVEAGDLAAAAEIVDALAARHPTVGLLPANRAALHMLAGEPEAAVAALEAAAARGYAELPRLLADPLFAPLARDPRLAGLAPAPPEPPVPAPLAAGVARVDGTNTLWDPDRGWLVARFGPAPPEDARGRAPVLGRQGGDAAYDRLRDLHREGRAAGNAGDLYDNRDRGHSMLPPERHPQVIGVRYGAAARASDADYGLNDRILFDRPTFGNSSTALTSGPFWRSLPRAALTRADGAGPWRLSEAYLANQIYVYPSHKDVTAGRGDLLPANTPYMIVAEGSSGADQPFLEAVAMILAAFRPDTKARLVEEGLLAPTVQFVFRRSQRSVLSREDYFSGLAHPSAFPFHEIGLARMVSLANSIAPDAIPPLVRLAVVEEDIAREGVDFFGEGLSEQLFDTPSAIARIWRGKAHTRRMTVSAAATRDPNGRPLAFHWRLLRGDPERVRITPSGDGARAEIAIDWQAPRPVADASPVVSSRVDIGVFASNGVHDSAPAFVSLLLPAHETRVYASGPDGSLRIAAIDHADPKHAGAYLDPMLMARADWRDDYRYDAEGRLTGWRRSRADRPAEDFDARGRRILEVDAAGSPARTVAVRYPLARGPAGGLVVREVPGADPAGADPSPPDPAG